MCMCAFGHMFHELLQKSEHPRPWMLRAPSHPKRMLTIDVNKINIIIVDDVDDHWNTTLDAYKAVGQGDGLESSSYDDSNYKDDDAT